MIEEILGNKIGKLEIELAQYKVAYHQVSEENAELKKLKEIVENNLDLKELVEEIRNGNKDK